MIGIYGALIRYGLAAAAIGALLLWGYNFVFDRGFAARDVLAVRDAAVADKAKTEALEAANQRIAELVHQTGEMAAKAQKERQDAARENDSLRARIRTGGLRLTIPAVCPPGAAAGGDPAAPGDGLQTRADIDPAAADALVGLVVEGDDAIRDLNLCVDQYEAVRIKYGSHQPLRP